MLGKQGWLQTKQLMTARQLKLAVLASGRGSNFDAICRAIERKDLNAQILVLISDQPQAPALAKATAGVLKLLPINPGLFRPRCL